MNEIDKSNWIGPFLCKASTTSMGFWMSFETRLPEEIIITVEAWVKGLDAKEKKSVSFSSVGLRYGVGLAELIDLKPDTQYSYHILVNGTPWFDSLKQEDFEFYTLPENRNVELVLMSCHGIEAYEKDPHTDDRDTWNMWHKLHDVLKSRSECRVGILGGDQVYMDETFGESLEKFNPTKPDETENKIYSTYKKYWKIDIYRKVMARLPCLLMWDDHDIIDGWGSREEQVADKSAQRWKIYGDLLFKAFDEMQASRNSGRLSQKKDSGYTFLFKHEGMALLGIDLRKERKRKDKTLSLLTDDSKHEIENAITNLSSKTKVLHILSPVTLARMGGDIEFFLGNISNFMWFLGTSKGTSFTSKIKRSFAGISLYSICFIGLFTITIAAPGTIQAFMVSVLLLRLMIKGRFKTYFPNKHTVVLSCLAIFSLLFAIHGIRGLYKLDIENKGIFNVIEILFVDYTGAFLHYWPHLILSNFILLYFLGVKSKRVQNFIKRKRKLDKNAMITYANVANKIGIALFSFFLAIIWWEGLPGEELKFPLILVFVFFGLITSILYIIAFLECIGAIDTIAGLNDDILDGWSAPEHSEDLIWLSKIIRMAANKNRKVYLLCGDIHTGGLSRIKLHHPEEDVEIHQITSSPISYVTMPPLVEKLTSGVGKVELKESLGANSRVICTLSNIFYRSNRNFVILKMNSDETLKVDFYFEDLNDGPISIDCR